jgi:hypothetical protein
MRSLAQGIVASHEARAIDLASIRQDVSALRESARRHVQTLEGPRRDASRTLHGHLAREHAKLARNEGRRKSGVRRWLSDLAEASAKSRDETQASLKNLASARRVMASHLKKDLAQGQARLRASVSTQLEELDQARKAMAQGQRDDLAQADAQRRPEVLNWLGGLTADRLAAGQEWRQMATAVQKRRAGVITTEAPAPKARKARAAMKTPPVKEAIEEEEEEEDGAEAREATPEPGALQDRVFGYLADHPDGVRLVAIEQEFRLNRLESNRVVRFLIEEGKAEKQGRVYFAA